MTPIRLLQRRYGAHRDLHSHPLVSGADEGRGDSGCASHHKGSQDPATRPCAGSGKGRKGRVWGGMERCGKWKGGRHMVSYRQDPVTL